MNALPNTPPRPARAAILAISLVIAAVVAAAPGTLAADPSASPSTSAEPAAAASPAASTAPASAMCASAADLSLIIGFLRATDISEDGIAPTLVGTIAGFAEARTLAGLVGETYRPLVDDLVGSLMELRVTLGTFGDAATVGAGVVAVGEALIDIGEAMDTLAVQLREPCPDLP